MMKSVFVLLSCCALVNQLQAQTYMARDAGLVGHKMLPVPEKVVRKFHRKYPGVQIDSCSVFGVESEPAVPVEYLFYTRQQNDLVRVGFNERGRLTELTTEVSLQELPQPLQQRIASKEQQGHQLGAMFKSQQMMYRDRKLLMYIVEQFIEYRGKRLKVPVYYDDKGYPLDKEG